MNRKTYLFGATAHNKTLLISTIAVLLALTVLAQFLCGLAGIQLLTGSVVNMFLLVASALCGLVGGVSVGLVTPFIALALGINPNAILVPFIALANAIYVAIYSCNKLFNFEKVWLNYLVKVGAVVVASFVKFCFMFFVCVKLILPLFMAEPVIAKLGATWGIIQFFAGLLGGVGCILLEVALSSRKIKLLNNENN